MRQVDYHITMNTKPRPTRKASELGRALAANRRLVEGTCAVCGKPFSGTAKRMYCSTLCAAKAYRRSHQEELNEKRRKKYARQKKTAEEETPSAAAKPSPHSQ